MKALRYPTKSEEAKTLNLRKRQLITHSYRNKNENFASECLKKYLPNIKFTRQARWGYRIFDFWNAYFGVAFEIDGKEHNKGYDGYRDERNFRRSGIIVLRAKNESIEEDIEKQTYYFSLINNWNERRKELGIVINGRKIDKTFVKMVGALPKEENLFAKYKEKIKEGRKVHLNDLISKENSQGEQLSFF